MKLNNKDKNKIREYIEEQLEEVPEGTRIHLDKDLLESLIFETIISKNEGIEIKFPVWTGIFLRKIDLSKISFENCVTANTISNIKNILIYELNITEEIAKKKANEIYKGEVDFSYTNININFNKTYTHEVNYCNFEGVDLSNSDISDLLIVSHCNFSRTNINNKIIKNYLEFKDCLFNYCDFSELTIKISEEQSFDEECLINFLLYNSFKNTYLKIECDDFTYLKEQYSQLFKDSCKIGKYDGCYLNGKLISPRNEITKRKIDINAEYSNLVNMTYTSIDNAISKEKAKKKTNNN